MSDEVKQEINLYDKIIVKNYENLSLAGQFEKGYVIKVDDELERVKQQLAIAVEGLEHFSECEDWNDPDFYVDKKEIADLADDYLKQIKELDKLMIHKYLTPLILTICLRNSKYL